MVKKLVVKKIHTVCHVPLWGQSFGLLGRLPAIRKDLGYTCGELLLLGAKYRSVPSRDGTCAISSSKDRTPILRLLNQSRNSAAPTQ